MSSGYWALVACLSFLAAGPAQSEKKSPSKPNEVEVRLADGSRVRMTILEESLVMVTRYGRLSIPTTEIRRIEFGIRPTEGIGKRVDDAIKLLTDENFQKRENAAIELVNIGAPAYRLLARAAKSPELDISRRAKAAMEKIRQKVPEDKLRLKAEDTITTAEFTVVGRIAAGSIKAKTPIFGEAQLRIADLRDIRWLDTQGEVEVAIDGAKYASATEWLDTGVELSVDDELAIAASGQIDLMSDGSGQYATGPNGSAQWGRQGAHQPGVLVGRIGAAGTAFVIGESYKGLAKKDGKLFLQIGQSPWARNNGGRVSGTYKVNITGGRDTAER